VTDHLTQDVASVPFLWVLPLVAYLFSFVLTFENDRWYRRELFLPATALLLALATTGCSPAWGRGCRPRCRCTWAACSSGAWCCTAR
jgi:hypothetical protein